MSWRKAIDLRSSVSISTLMYLSKTLENSQVVSVLASSLSCDSVCLIKILIPKSHIDKPPLDLLPEKLDSYFIKIKFGLLNIPTKWHVNPLSIATPWQFLIIDL